MASPPLPVRLLVLCLAGVAAVGCRTAAPGEDMVSVEPGAGAQTVDDEQAGPGIALRGVPIEQRTALRRIAAPFAADFVETGKKSYVDDAAYEIELHLRQNGYAKATTDYEVLGRDQAAVGVDAGPRAALGDVRVVVEGDSPIPRDDLELYVNGPTTGLFGTGPMLYVERRVMRAPDELRRDLEALGYLDAEASIDEPEVPSDGGEVQVTLRVAPGAPYRIGEVEFALARTADSLSDELQGAVDEAIETTLEETGSATEVDGAEGARYRPRLAGALRGAIGDALASNGHPDAEVSVGRAIDAVAKSVDLAITLDPGPYVILKDVEIRGHERTSKSFLRSRMELEDGDEFDAKELRASLRRLYRTGLFSQVTSKLQGDGEARSVLVEVTERPAIELFAEPGYGSYELGRLTVGARDRNLFGRGINGTAEATLAVRALRADVGLSDPWFLRRELIGDLRVEFDRREEPSFTRESRGVGAFVTKEWTSTQSTTLGYRFRRSEAKDVEVVDETVRELQSAVNVSGLIVTQRYDARDALFAPTSGAFTEVSAEVAADALGSELSFFRTRLTTALFTEVTEDDVLGVGLRMGLIAPALDDSEIPLQERFFAGGENSVRSFRESQLGPEDSDGQPLGGEAFGTLSVEWRRELSGPFQTAVFVDAGFVEPQASDIFDLEDVRYGVGVGLRYLLPIGPLRVDAAFNPDRERGENEWVVHFGIGMPF